MSDTNTIDQNKSSKNKRVLPFGTWPSSLSPEEVAGRSPHFGEPQLCGGDIFWLEMRPQEQGRIQVVRQNADGLRQDILPDGYAARSRVHEYGGGGYLATSDYLYFVNNEDQCLYALALTGNPQKATPRPLTPPGDLRFADLHVDLHRQRLLAVCEDHSAGHHQVANYLIAVSLSEPHQTASVTPDEMQILARGSDFYSNPRVSPDGRFMTWLTWNHPAMPWDATRLWLAKLDTSGELQWSVCIAGKDGEESLFQPQWSPKGDLYFVSDRTNWWNIYRLSAAALQQTKSGHLTHAVEAVTQLTGEFATPQWTFNMSTYGFLDANHLLATYTQDGLWHLVTVDLATREINEIESPLTQFSALHCRNGHAVLLAASPTQGNSIYRYSRDELSAIVQPAAPIDITNISQPQNIRFTTSENRQAHALFYPPKHCEISGPAAPLPPVIVIGHGGPTGATETSLNLKIQYWTNRGFAVLDVNYRGSTGYGREYRRELYGHWGQHDVDDVCAAVDYVTNQGWVHPRQRIIKGSSAGGYTVLAALVFRDTFDAGVSLYGIGDLELLAQDTHKFEARYLDTLVGPYPQEKARYRALSPIYHVNQLRCPLLVFQGLEDKVVPPNQAEAMVDAVAKQKIPVAYVTYANEGHGFRQSDNIAHMLDAEQYFYQRLFKLIDHSNMNHGQPLTIINLDNEQ